MIKTRSIPELDTLRFFSVTFVTLLHLFFKENFVLEWFSKHGYVGVDVFFTLSGFIITKTLIKEYDATQTINLKKFWIRRVLRLWPSLYLALFLSIILTYFFGGKNKEILEVLSQRWWHYFLHLGNYSNAFLGKIHTLFSHYWSLAVEEHFYLVWPLLFLSIRRSPKRRKVIFFLIFILPYLFRVFHKINGAENIINTFSTHTRFDSLGYGCALAFIYDYIPSLRSKFVIVSLYIVFILIMWMGLELKYSEVSFWLSELGHTLRALAAALLITLITKTPVNNLRGFWRNTFLSKLGILSYGVYLFHFHTNTVLFFVIKKLNLSFSQISLALIACALPYLPAYLTYRYVDQYFEKYKDHFR